MEIDARHSGSLEPSKNGCVRGDLCKFVKWADRLFLHGLARLISG